MVTAVKLLMWRSLYTVHIHYIIGLTVCTNWDSFNRQHVPINKEFQIQSTLWACFYCTTTGAIAYSNAYFGRGTGPILLDDLLCTGREARLIDCPRSTSQGIGTYDFCPRGHGEDAGVGCATRKYNKLDTHIYSAELAISASLHMNCTCTHYSL